MVSMALGSPASHVFMAKIKFYHNLGVGDRMVSNTFAVSVQSILVRLRLVYTAALRLKTNQFDSWWPELWQHLIKFKTKARLFQLTDLFVCWFGKFFVKNWLQMWQNRREYNDIYQINMQMEQIFQYNAKYRCKKCEQQWFQQNNLRNKPTLCKKCGMPAYPSHENIISFFSVPRFRSISKLLTKWTHDSLETMPVNSEMLTNNWTFCASNTNKKYCLWTHFWVSETIFDNQIKIGRICYEFMNIFSLFLLMEFFFLQTMMSYLAESCYRQI